MWKNAVGSSIWGQYNSCLNSICGDDRNLWQLILYKKQGHPIKDKYIKCLALACHIPNPLGVTLPQASQALQDATTRYLALKPQHNLLHAEFLQAQLRDPSLSEEHHKAIAHLVSLKALHNSYHHIWAICQQLMGCSISLVEYSSPMGTVLATSRSEVETAPSSVLQTCFKNVHGSPFLQAPLAPLVSNFGTGPAVTAILEGTFQCPPGTDEQTKKFIEALHFHSLEVCHCKVSTLCILKILFLIGARQRADIFFTIQTSFWPLQGCVLLSGSSISPWPLYPTCLMTGLSLTRYQASLQVILEKKSGTIHVNNLHAILLMEGDFQQ